MTQLSSANELDTCLLPAEMNVFCIILETLNRNSFEQDIPFGRGLFSIRNGFKRILSFGMRFPVLEGHLSKVQLFTGPL